MPQSSDEQPPDPWADFFQKAKQLATTIKEAGPEGVVDIAYDGIDRGVRGAVLVSHLAARLGKRAMERTIESLEKGAEAVEDTIKQIDEGEDQ